MRALVSNEFYPFFFVLVSVERLKWSLPEFSDASLDDLVELWTSISFLCFFFFR